MTPPNPLPANGPVRIAILDDYQDAARSVADWSRLPARCDVTVIRETLGDADDVVERLRPFHILVSMRERTRFPEQVLARLPNLRFIAATGARQSNIDLPAATQRGIPVVTTASPGHSTTELTWALILAVTRRIPQEDAAMRAGRWQTTVGVGLDGKTLGIIGLGRVGSDTARIAPAFSMRTVVWSPSMTQDRAAQYGAEAVTKDRLFAESDVVTIHVPLNQGTRDLVTARELGLMKPSAYLVNTSRGPIVREADLIDALSQRRIAGAGLDVYDQEPLPADHPLTRLDNVVLTPHLGYVTEENYRIFYGESLDNILAFLSGAPTNILNPDALTDKAPGA